MEYSKIETEIASRLNAYFALISVIDTAGNTVLFNSRVRAQEFAEDTKQADKPFQTSLVSVAFWKTVPQDSSSLNIVVQEETHMLEIAIQARQLRGVFGAYSVIDQVKKALIGYRPEQSTTRIVMDSGPEMQGKENVNNTWVLTMNIKFNALNTQAFDDEEISDVLLKEVTYNEELYIPAQPTFP